MNYGLEGKTYVVTGAAQGIGAEISLRLLNQGAKVLAIDLKSYNGSELEEKVDGIFSDHHTHYLNLNFRTGDASDFEVTKDIIQRYLGTHSLDGLVNNAGLLGLEPKIDEEQYERYMDAHAKTVCAMTNACYPLMQQGGSIVNMGSIELRMSTPRAVLYTGGKGAVWGFTRGFAADLAPKIRVNMVSPGNVNTRANVRQYQEDPETRKLLQHFEERTPMKRSVEPREVADTVLFLLSDGSSGITAVDIVVDCGYTNALHDAGWSK